ncbi:MAG: hypothetical protein QOF95_615 [Pseudonocardiales bacterium]|jgi:hypothetical protein|nr:hypothetical protein [Pseudonocardiales bacterium]
MSPTLRVRAAALTAATAVTGMSILTLVALAPNAAARGGGGGITKAGNCSGSTDWKLKVKADNGALESEFEVDSNRVGQHWTYRIIDNGVTLRLGPATTHAPSGSFTVRTLSRNRAGADHFVARARNAATHELCVGSLTF